MEHRRAAHVRTSSAANDALDVRERAAAAAPSVMASFPSQHHHSSSSSNSASHYAVGTEYVSPLPQSSSSSSSNTTSLRRSLTRERLHPQQQHAPQWFTAAPLLTQFYASSSPLSLSSITTSSSQYQSHPYEPHSQQQQQQYESHRYAVESHRLHQHHSSHHHVLPPPPPQQQQQQQHTLRRLSLYDLRASTSSSNASANSPVEQPTTSTSAPNPTEPAATTAPETAAPDREAPAPKRKKTALRLRNFLCMHPGCGKAFTDNAHLRDHTFVHTGERSVHCSTCGKAFGRLSTLHDHERVHTRAQPYACPHDGCDKRYSSRSALRFHASRHAEVSSAIATDQQCPRPSVSTAASTAIQTDNSSSDAMRGAAADTDSAVVSSLHATIATQQMQIAALQAELARLQRSHHAPAKSRARAGGPPRRRTAPTATAPPMVAPVRFLLDGVKPFECHVCHHRVANYFQLAFHAKQHPSHALDDVVRAQAPLPVGPKFCPEPGCVYAEANGAPLKNLQTLKRHWQRRHTLARPYACTRCVTATGAPIKTFKTRENLRAHEKECRGTHDSRSGSSGDAERERPCGDERTVE